MKNYMLSISYDGTDFHGFQIQKDRITVQGELQKALEIFTKKYDLNYSGRTDAGVHAKEQVINIKTELAIDKDTINSINKILGSKISINSFKQQKITSMLDMMQLRELINILCQILTNNTLT